MAKNIEKWLKEKVFNWVFFTTLIVVVLLWSIGNKLNLDLKQLQSSDNFPISNDIIVDFYGRGAATVVALVTLWIVYLNFKKLNYQTLHSSVALLIQTYNDMVDDYEIESETIEKKNGREAIQELINVFKEKYNEVKEGQIFRKGETTFDKFLQKEFPTHLPAIIVGILYKIEKYEGDDTDKENLNKLVKIMLSYEERALLLLFVAEQISFGDEDRIEDWPLIKKIFFKDKKSKLLQNYNECRGLFGIIDLDIDEETKLKEKVSEKKTCC